MEVLFRSYELETANIIIGNYIKEDGFYMENGEPICGKPCTRHYIQDEDCIKHEIAPEYLSISFEDMIDREGTKIFASLREDGKGGDNLQYQEAEWETIYEDCQFIIHCKVLDYLVTPLRIALLNENKIGGVKNRVQVVGIQK